MPGGSRGDAPGGPAAGPSVTGGAAAQVRRQCPWRRRSWPCSPPPRSSPQSSSPPPSPPCPPQAAPEGESCARTVRSRPTGDSGRGRGQGRGPCPRTAPVPRRRLAFPTRIRPSSSRRLPWRRMPQRQAGPRPGWPCPCRLQRSAAKTAREAGPAAARHTPGPSSKSRLAPGRTAGRSHPAPCRPAAPAGGSCGGRPPAGPCSPCAGPGPKGTAAAAAAARVGWTARSSAAGHPCARLRCR
mmetsp:Transcript_16648/g.65010  ORF Transcript_16648/g.65010 Transcript_16648/m.65010 type:complete len:241 (-) Transcript_16648:909-1631(-)